MPQWLSHVWYFSTNLLEIGKMNSGHMTPLTAEKKCPTICTGRPSTGSDVGNPVVIRKLQLLWAAFRFGQRAQILESLLSEYYIIVQNVQQLIPWFWHSRRNTARNYERYSSQASKDLTSSSNSKEHWAPTLLIEIINIHYVLVSSRHRFKARTDIYI